MTGEVEAVGVRAETTAEDDRLRALGDRDWRLWGTYLPERQWGTVREDTSADGQAWESFSYAEARRRAYRSGEDGLLGWCDREARLCFSTALWNGRDDHLKERLFGLTNGQGNHGEDVKELYHYVDAVPSGSDARALYRYPQCAFPYDDLSAENGRRGFADPEYELLDAGALDGDRHFDLTVEYAMADEVGTFEGTLAKLAAGKAPARRASAPKSLAPRVGMSVAPVPAPKVLVPSLTPLPVPAISPAVAKALAVERERAAALLAVTPEGADEEFRVALERGDLVEAYRETLVVREVEAMLRWARGG